jgi:4-hydroxy-3-polyprenylbenzoate decarboxylase
MNTLPLVMAITGASGAPYALRLLQLLHAAGRDVHLTVSPSGRVVLQQELNVQISLEHFDPRQLWHTATGEPWWSRYGDGFATSGLPGMAGGEQMPGKIVYHHYQDFMTPIASGSFLTGGMVICPCSGGTLSGVAHGASNNLIERAAEVHLKERRKLVVVPRETPVSAGYLRNLQGVAEAGAVVLPAMPGWYHGVRHLVDLIDFIVARILDHLAVDHVLIRRWGEKPRHV